MDASSIKKKIDATLLFLVNTGFLDFYETCEKETIYTHLPVADFTQTSESHEQKTQQICVEKQTQNI